MKIFKKVKTIVSLRGETHFERWAIIETSKFAWYLHKIQKEDKDDMHSHPWNFVSLTLRGSYLEEVRKQPSDTQTILNLKKPFKIAFFNKSWFHSIRRIIDGPVWTTVWVWGGSFEGDRWHYLVISESGLFYCKVPFEEYRKIKTEAKVSGKTMLQVLTEWGYAGKSRLPSFELTKD